MRDFKYIPEVIPNRTLEQLNATYEIINASLYSRQTGELAEYIYIDTIKFDADDIIYLIENPELLPKKKKPEGLVTTEELMATYEIRRRTLANIRHAQMQRAGDKYDETDVKPEDVFTLHKKDDPFNDIPLENTKLSPVQGKPQMNRVRIIRMMALLAQIDQQSRIEELEGLLRQVKNIGLAAGV